MPLPNLPQTEVITVSVCTHLRLSAAYLHVRRVLEGFVMYIAWIYLRTAKQECFIIMFEKIRK